MRCLLRCLSESPASIFPDNALKRVPVKLNRNARARFFNWSHFLRKAASTFPENALAAGTLLFAFDALLHTERGARILAGDLAERGASRFAFAQGRQRLAEAKQRFGRLCRCFVLGG